MTETPRDSETADSTPADPVPAGDGTVIDAARWFDGRREVWIEYAGMRYRLRLTRRNKLILQK